MTYIVRDSILRSTNQATVTVTSFRTRPLAIPLFSIDRHGWLGGGRRARFSQSSAFATDGT